jgi:hypothetical protein
MCLQKCWPKHVLIVHLYKHCKTEMQQNIVHNTILQGNVIQSIMFPCSKINVVLRTKACSNDEVLVARLGSDRRVLSETAELPVHSLLPYNRKYGTAVILTTGLHCPHVSSGCGGGTQGPSRTGKGRHVRAEQGSCAYLSPCISRVMLAMSNTQIWLCPG